MNKMNKKLLLAVFSILLISISLFYINYFEKKDQNDLNATLLTHSSVTSNTATPDSKRLVYIVSDLRIPFWSIMAKGIEKHAVSLGYRIDIYSAENDPKKELEFTAKAFKENVSGIIISPTTSSACATILKLAKHSGIPVVISDIGTDGGEYVSYISSDNREGAYQIGMVLAHELQKKGWGKSEIAIIAIPQKRLNGQERTAGFMQAMNESGIKNSDIRQQATFSYEETYTYSKELINNNPKLRALWLQGSDRYQGALDAIRDSGKKDQILLLTFDAEPEFLQLIPKGILVGSAMQQPYLMGEQSVQVMVDHLHHKPVEKNIKLPVLAISSENIKENMVLIERNVLGLND